MVLAVGGDWRRVAEIHHEGHEEHEGKAGYQNPERRAGHSGQGRKDATENTVGGNGGEKLYWTARLQPGSPGTGWWGRSAWTDRNNTNGNRAGPRAAQKIAACPAYSSQACQPIRHSPDGTKSHTELDHQ